MMNAQYTLEMVTRTEVDVTMPNGQTTTIPSEQAVALINNMAAKGIKGALIIRNGRVPNQDVAEAALNAAGLTGYAAAKAQASGRIEF